MSDLRYLILDRWLLLAIVLSCRSTGQLKYRPSGNRSSEQTQQINSQLDRSRRLATKIGALASELITSLNKHTFMSLKISLWVGLIGLAANISLMQSAVAKSSIEIVKNTVWRDVAIAEAKKATASDRFASGIQKYRKGDVQGALADFNRAIELDPKYAIAYYGRGFLAVEKLQDLQGALADFNRAIELDPNNAVAYCARGVLKHEYLSDKSGDVLDLQTAAKLYQQQGRTQEYQHAIDLLKKWQQSKDN